VFWFSLQHLSARIEWDIINVYWPRCEVRISLVRLWWNLNFLDRFFKKYSCIKFNDLPSCSLHGHTDLSELIVAFCSFLNVPKTENCVWNVPNISPMWRAFLWSSDVLEIVIKTVFKRKHSKHLLITTGLEKGGSRWCIYICCIPCECGRLPTILSCIGWGSLKQGLAETFRSNSRCRKYRQLAYMTCLTNLISHTGLGILPACNWRGWYEVTGYLLTSIFLHRRH
jgi:hypothetical protein